MWSYNIKIIVYSKEGKQRNFTFSLEEYTWHILETNVKLQKVGFKSYLHFKKPTWNLLLQLKIKNKFIRVKKYLVLHHLIKKFKCIIILWWVLVVFFVNLTSRLPR